MLLSSGVPVGGPGLNQVYLRSSDANVICDSRKVQAGEPIDIFVKVATERCLLPTFHNFIIWLCMQVAVGASPQVKKFFVAIYADAYLSRPVQTWQFYVHAMQRVDVSSIEGQTSRFTLMLRYFLGVPLYPHSTFAAFPGEPKPHVLLSASHLILLKCSSSPKNPLCWQRTLCKSCT
jgi:hypothetical protein